MTNRSKSNTTITRRRRSILPPPKVFLITWIIAINKSPLECMCFVPTTTSTSFPNQHDSRRIRADYHTLQTNNDIIHSSSSLSKLGNADISIEEKEEDEEATIIHQITSIQNTPLTLPKSSLPILNILHTVRSSLQTKPNLVLEAPPGAGKTTVIPLALLTEISKWNSAKKQDEDEEELTNIWLIEPRRVATKSASSRMSTLLRTPLGSTIGYAIRGDTRLSSQTKITVVTEGVLLNQLQKDPFLEGIDVVIFDEYHERSLNSDVALALCRDVQRSIREDLRIVVMSATLLGEVVQEKEEGGEESTGTKLLKTLGGDEECHVLRSEGRQYPIDVQYWTPSSSSSSSIGRSVLPPLGAMMNQRKLLISTMADAVQDAISIAPNNGNVLVFLPGVKEIKNLMRELLEDTSRRRRIGVDDDDGKVEVLPLYGALPKHEQDYVVFPPPNHHKRRIIISTPIAEASLTLQDVTCVVDSGLKREPLFDHETKMSKLITVRCSRDAAKQRAGRAGRTQKGACLRIYSEAEFSDKTKFLEHSRPEIWNADLTAMVLLLLDSWGCFSVDDIVEKIPFVDLPKVGDLVLAFDLLMDLGAIELQQQEKKPRKKEDYRYRITEHGRVISKMPIHPRLATAIAKASSKEDVFMLAAAVSAAYLLDDETGDRGGNLATVDLAPRVQNLLYSDTTSHGGKSLLQFASRVSKEARDAVQSIMERKTYISDVTSSLGEALLPGFIDLVAQRRGDASYGGSTYMISLGRSARLDKPRNGDGGTSDPPDFAIILDTSTGDDGKTRIRSYATIDENVLRQDDVSVERDVLFTVPTRGHEVRARRIRTVGALELSSVPTPIAPSPEDVAAILIDTIRDLGGVYKALYPYLSKEKKKMVENLRSRVRLASSSSDDGVNLWPSCFAALDVTTKGDSSSGTSSDITMDLDEAEETLEALVEPWLAPAGSLKNVDLLDILFGSMAPEQQYQLDNDFPTHIMAPDRSRIPLSYNTGTPIASAKLQQFFGTTESPCVGGIRGKSIPVTLELLSPSGKLLAQTVDLPFFWKETYPTVRAEMRGRYAKHPWPEDPLSAVATRRTKKQEAAATAAGSASRSAKVDKRKEKSAARKKKKGK